MNDYLGNINSEWHVLTQPSICKKETCTPNTEDLIVRKQQINKDQHNDN